MSQHYSNPDREHEETALPDVEVFQIVKEYEYPDEQGNPYQPGWYWWYCFPGCLPDSDPAGPFQTKADALADAQSNND